MRLIRTLCATALLLVPASGALAAPCISKGDAKAAEVRIDFRRDEHRALAQALAPVLFDAVVASVQTVPRCERELVKTDRGEYRLAGEDADAVPRFAVPTSGAGPLVYLAPAPGADPTGPRHLALVVIEQGGTNRIASIYRGIPDDRRLAAEIRSALSARGKPIAAYRPNDATLTFGDVSEFASLASFSASLGQPGPQIKVAGEPSNMRLVDITPQAVFHVASGYPCPQRFGSLPVLLMEVDPGADRVMCTWRSGADIAYHADPVRYRLTYAKRPGVSPQALLSEALAEASSIYTVKGGRAPPAPAGPQPAPQQAAARRTAEGYTLGLWAGSYGEWTLQLTGAWPAGQPGDAEAAQVARGLFKLASELQAQRADTAQAGVGR